MRIDIANTLGWASSIRECDGNRAPKRLPLRWQVGHMIGIAGAAKATDFTINASVTPPGVLQFFQNENASTFAQHKAVSITIKRTRCPLRIMISLRKRANHIKASHDK